MNQYPLTYLYIYHKVCNQKCKHCWIVPSFNYNSFKCIEIEYIKKAVEEAIKLGLKMVKLTGGEPLLIPYIKELIYFLKEKNLKIAMETNGILIDHEMAKIIKDNQVFVSLSLDSKKPEIHDEFRNLKGAWNKTVKVMKLLKEYEIKFQTIVSLSIFNKDEIEEIINFAFLNGSESVKINIIQPIGRGKEMEEKNELLSIKEILEIYKKIYYEFIKWKDLKVYFDIPPAFLYGKSLFMKGGCPILNVLSIFTDGAISICGIGNIIKELNLGNIKKDSIKEVWEKSEILKNLRKILSKGLKGICGKCIFKKYCLGECRAFAYFVEKDFSSPFPFCEIAYKEGIFPEGKIKK